MKLQDIYYIKEIDNKTAQELVIKNHYLHRRCPCSKAYGLFDRNSNRLVGCVVYGSPASPSLCKGICGKEERLNIYELTRLWIEDGTPKNTESFLIGNTLKLLDKEIIVSFADSSVGHVGIVYQATNFIYTGLSKKRTEKKILGKSLHSRSIWRGENVQQLKEKYGDNLVTVNRPQKHRYVFFNTSSGRRKHLLKQLKYPILPYPK